MAYYFFKYNRTKEKVSKAEIARAFGYASDGHFYPDFNYLLDEGIISEVDNYYEFGKEGKVEFRFLTLALITLSFSIGFSISFMVFYFTTFTGITITPLIYPFMSVLSLFNAVICYLTLKTFTPELPEEVKTLKHRGRISRLKEWFSST